MLRANLLNDVANLSIEQDDSDDFSSDCEDNSEDDFCEWDIKSGLYMFTYVRKLWDRGSLVVHTETSVLFFQCNLSLFLETFVNGTLLTLSVLPTPQVLKPCTKRVL